MKIKLRSPHKGVLPGVLILIFTLPNLLSNGLAHAQNVASTTLDLRFENSLSGEQGEVPVSAAGYSFQSGVKDQAVSLPAGSQLFYTAAGNIHSREGTIEFWIRPAWAGSDNQTHTILDWNGSFVGGMRIDKHGLNKLSVSLDRFAGWREAEVDVSSWQPNQWHFVAVTYSNTTKIIQVYIDGERRAQTLFTGELPLISAPNFRIGAAPNDSNPINAALDEFRISDGVRTAAEIRSRFVWALTVNSISLSAATKNLWRTWRIAPVIAASTNIGPVNIHPATAAWTNSNPSAASINSEGEIVGIDAGIALLTANVHGAEAGITVTVKAPVRALRVDQPTGFRSAPAAGSLYEIPVISLRYLPTADGVNLDTAWAPGYWTLEPISLATLEHNLDQYDEIRKYMLEEGSRFRGYGSQSPPPSLGYRVVATITVYEPSPPGKILGMQQGYPLYNSEMIQMLERLGIQEYIEDQGVKEIWYWTGQLEPNMPSYNAAIHSPENFRMIPESNMASPTTGDVSNSNRDNTDLPVYDRTYIVWHQWMRRLDTLTLHVDGHQLEQMLMHVNWLQDGNNHLFWRKFVGYDSSGAWQRGRAGWTHLPPNGEITQQNGGYDYHNYNPFNTDITDWRPGGGQVAPYSAATARDTPYTFPNTFLPLPHAEVHWYIFWRQSMPGADNAIPYETVAGADAKARGDASHHICTFSGITEDCVPANFQYSTDINAFDHSRAGTYKSAGETSGDAAVSNRMTNWWQFVGDWDRAIRAGIGLYEHASCSYTLSAGGQNFPASGGQGSVTVTAGSGCRWFASNNAPWTALNAGDISIGTNTVNFTIAPNSANIARNSKIIIAGKVFTVSQNGVSGGRAPFDFDGDGKSDVGIYRANAGEWWYLRSSDGGNRAFGFGSATDKIVPVDFTGDGKTDLGFWRPSTGFWYVMRSEDNTFYGFPFGAEGDIPVPGDYDADGKADAAVFRAGSWYILQSSNNSTRVDALGTAGDRPVTADYDGDGKSDIAIYRPTGGSGAGEWWINMSTAGLRAVAFGTSTDKAVPGDYTGDGKADIAIWRPSTGFWYIIRSEDFSFYGFPFGADGDVPAPGDYDGDGRFDAAVFRSGTWYINRSTAGQQVVGFGAAGDTPVPSSFVR